LYFFFWPLFCLFFFDIWILITPLVSSNSSFVRLFSVWLHITNCSLLVVLIWSCATQCGRQSTMILVSERLLFNAKGAIFQLYHGTNSLRVNDMMMMIALDQYVYFHCAKSLKQQFVSRNIAPFESTILIPNKIVFALLFLNIACLAE